MNISTISALQNKKHLQSYDSIKTLKVMVLLC